MTDERAFVDLIRRVRADDQQAAAELVRQYEPEIRCEVRLRLRQARLRRLLDSMDICQSVLASFFVRAASGQYDLQRPEQLVALLVTIARNKAIRAVRRQRAQRRDDRRHVVLSGSSPDLASAEPSASRIVSGRELLAEVRSRLSEEERRLADLRAEGRQWAAIASEVGGTPQARRKQLARAIDRVSIEIGLED